MVRFPCPHCKAALKVSQERRGAALRCVKCRQPVRVPESVSVQAEAPAAAADNSAMDWSALQNEPSTAAPKTAASVRRSAPPRPPLSRNMLWVVGASVGGLLLVLVAGLVIGVMAWNANRKTAQALAKARQDADAALAATKSALPAENPKEEPGPSEKLKTPPPEKPAQPVEKPAEPVKPVEKPVEPAPLVDPESKPPAPPAKEEDPKPAPKPVPADPKPAVPPKALSKNVLAGLDYLARMQLANGAWAEGLENENPGNPAASLPSVAHTSLVGLAFLRAGASPSKGNSATRLTRAVDFVCTQVEKADKESLLVGGNVNTYIKQKLGKYIDTYCALWFLAEVKGRMADDKANARVDKALAKVIDKMQRHQLPDGSWDSQGVSPGVAKAIAAKGMNRAKQAGAAVDDKVLEKAAKNGRDYFDRVASGKPIPVGAFGELGLNALGIDLYSAAGNLGMVQEGLGTARQAELDARLIAESPGASEAEKAAAKKVAERLAEAEKGHRQALEVLAKQLHDENFLMALGSYGGEEFLSFQVISEALVSSDSKDWAKWDKFVTTGMAKTQNRDGSWSGGHCLTGRTFCTAAALLTLLADRAPAPNAAK